MLIPPLSLAFGHRDDEKPVTDATRVQALHQHVSSQGGGTATLGSIEVSALPGSRVPAVTVSWQSDFPGSRREVATFGPSGALFSLRNVGPNNALGLLRTAHGNMPGRREERE